MDSPQPPTDSLVSPDVPAQLLRDVLADNARLRAELGAAIARSTHTPNGRIIARATGLRDELDAALRVAGPDTEDVAILPHWHLAAWRTALTAIIELAKTPR